MAPADKRNRSRLFAALSVVCMTVTAGYIWQTGGAAAEMRDEALPEMSSSPIVEFETAPEATPTAPEAGAATTPAPEPEPQREPEPPAPRSGDVVPARMPSCGTGGARREPPAAASPAPLFLVRHTGTDKSYGRLAAESARRVPHARRPSSIASASTSPRAAASASTRGEARLRPTRQSCSTRASSRVRPCRCPASRAGRGSRPTGAMPPSPCSCQGIHTTPPDSRRRHESSTV